MRPGGQSSQRCEISVREDGPVGGGGRGGRDLPTEQLGQLRAGAVAVAEVEDVAELRAAEAERPCRLAVQQQARAPPVR